MTIAYKRDMYCINQMWSLPQRSTLDAALSLNHCIRKYQFAGKKVSSVFLYMKGGFDNVNHKKPFDQLGTDGRVREYLVNWRFNFIYVREIALAYPGSARTQNKLDKDIPQCSPLSPL